MTKGNNFSVLAFARSRVRQFRWQRFELHPLDDRTQRKIFELFLCLHRVDALY